VLSAQLEETVLCAGEEEKIFAREQQYHNGTKVELGVCGRGANWAKNGAPYILVYSAIILLKDHLKPFIGRYLSKESFYLTICMKNVCFKVDNKT
jgi:hypothetical protein